MIPPRTIALVGFAVVLAAAVSFRSRVAADDDVRDLQPFRNPAGSVLTISTDESFSRENAFFRSLGTNGRTCGTCHQASDGWTITPVHVRDRFNKSGGDDPIFRLNDGATCPSAQVSTMEARQKAYGMLLTKGLIRVGLPVPSNAAFSLVAVDDPYNCASAAELSLFRRPLPSTNLKFLSAVMWDGRETHAGQPLAHDLRQQAIDATLGHAQATDPPTGEELDEIVSLEMGLFTAQIQDREAGRLNRKGAQGGPVVLSEQPFFLGINDPIGLNPTGAPFNPRAFSIFNAWRPIDGRQEAQRAVARGQELFNTRPVTITGVGGLNDVLGAPSIVGTCTTCHDTPNVGNHSIAMALNIGTSDASRRTPDLPLYTLRCDATGEVVQTTDPGRALITGKCADIGKVKGPVLRALAARAPYFHNGSAATLMDVVNFYDDRFHLKLTPQEKADLVVFLQSL